MVFVGGVGSGRGAAGMVVVASARARTAHPAFVGAAAGLGGFGFAAHAEYVAVPEKAFLQTIAHMPSNATFEEAAALPIGGPTGRGHSARVLVTTPTTPHEESPNENLSSSTSHQDEVEVQVEDDESQLLSNKERKRRRKERKEQKRLKEQEAEQRRLEKQRQTLVYQSVAAGATIGAVAVAASVFLGNPRK